MFLSGSRHTNTTTTLTYPTCLKGPRISSHPTGFTRSNFYTYIIILYSKVNFKWQTILNHFWQLGLFFSIAASDYHSALLFVKSHG